MRAGVHELRAGTVRVRVRVRVRVTKLSSASCVPAYTSSLVTGEG